MVCVVRFVCVKESFLYHPTPPPPWPPPPPPRCSPAYGSCLLGLGLGLLLELVVLLLLVVVVVVGLLLLDPLVPLLLVLEGAVERVMAARRVGGIMITATVATAATATATAVGAATATAIGAVEAG